MGFATQRLKIETLFFTQFAILEPTIKFGVENDNFSTGDAAWVRISIRYAGSEPFALGSINARTTGIIMLQIFTRPGTGAAESDRIADSISDIFREQRIDGVNYGTPSLGQVTGTKHSGAGEKRDGWFQSMVNVDFWVDEFF